MDSATSTSSNARLALILDTNVLMDAWVFRHPSWLAIEQYLREGQAEVMISPPIWQEYGWVLERTYHSRHETHRKQAQSQWQEMHWPWPPLCEVDVAHIQTSLQLSSEYFPLNYFRVKDRSDQMFMDLAVHGALQHAPTLVLRDEHNHVPNAISVLLLSRDKALLRLRHRAKTLGIAIIRPEEFSQYVAPLIISNSAQTIPQILPTAPIDQGV